MKEKQNMEQWLAAATSGIRFKPDRRAVEEELRGHFEDKVADLQRVFHISAEEAEEMALERMGDPERIGKELAKIHRPWLGYLWQLSRVVFGLALVLCLVAGLGGGERLWGWYLEPWRCEPPVALAPESARMGSYTFKIKEAVFVDYPEESGLTDQVRVTFRVSTPRFWENISHVAVQMYTTLETADGQTWPMDRQRLYSPESTFGPFQVLSGLEQRRTGLFYREYTAYADAPWQEGDRAALNFDFEQGELSLSAKLVRIEGDET